MTAEKQEQRQIQGSFAALQDDGGEQATPTTSAARNYGSGTQQWRVLRASGLECSGAEAAEDVEVDDEGYEAAEGGAPGSAVGDDGAWDLVEGEEEDDIGGEKGAEQGVVDAVGGEGEEGGVRPRCRRGGRGRRRRR